MFKKNAERESVKARINGIERDICFKDKIKTCFSAGFYFMEI